MSNTKIVRITRTIAVFLGVLLVVAVCSQLPSRNPEGPEIIYKGKSLTDWASECMKWEVFMSGESMKSGRWYIWRRVSVMDDWYHAALGQPPRVDFSEPALLQYDSSAVPLLLELLKHPESKVRKMAIQGLKRLGSRAEAAIPNLHAALCTEENLDISVDIRDALIAIEGTGNTRRDYPTGR